MENTILLPELAALHIQEGPTLHYGGDQEWYTDTWQRRAGCGPTNCANLLWYLTKTRPGCQALCPYDATQKQGFVRLMEEVWQRVTPGKMGVNTTAIFVEGAKKYALEKGVALQADALVVDRLCKKNRAEGAAYEFVKNALQRNQPVAFLNLSNGALTNLDSWHWVTIVALQGQQAMIFDQGQAKWIDLQVWHTTSVMGGGFVALEKV